MVLEVWDCRALYCEPRDFSTLIAGEKDQE